MEKRKSFAGPIFNVTNIMLTFCVISNIIYKWYLLSKQALMDILGNGQYRRFLLKASAGSQNQQFCPIIPDPTFLQDTGIPMSLLGSPANFMCRS